MTAIQNILSNIPSHLHNELFETLAGSGHIRIERIIFQGHASPEGFWYDQDQSEFVILLQGAAQVRFEGEQKAVEMKPGDYLNIPAHRKHRVNWTAPDEPTIPSRSNTIRHTISRSREIRWI